MNMTNQYNMMPLGYLKALHIIAPLKEYFIDERWDLFTKAQ